MIFNKYIENILKIVFQVFLIGSYNQQVYMRKYLPNL